MMLTGLNVTQMEMERTKPRRCLTKTWWDGVKIWSVLGGCTVSEKMEQED